MEFNIGDIMIGIGVGIVMCVVFFNWSVSVITRRIQNELELEDSNIGMRVEVDQDIIYCYNSETDQFLCQGRNLAEITEAFRSRFQNSGAYIDDGDPEILKKWKVTIQNETGNLQ